MHCIVDFQKLTTTPCLVLLQVKAAQPSTCQDIGVGTGENGLTASALGAMVTWLGTRQMDGNAYTIDRSGSEL